MRWASIGMALMIGLAAGAPASAATCDRACLGGYMTRYLDALQARDPKRLPVTADVRFTENGVAIPLGEALWVTIRSIGGFRQDYVDTEAQQIATIVNMTENERPGLISIRLKIVDGAISEIETVLNRNNRGAPTMRPADPRWNEVEPPATRLTRAQLAAAAEGYARAVAASDSRFVKFNQNSCIRFENTTVMALLPTDPAPGPLMQPTDPNAWGAAVAKTIPMDCSKQLDTGIYGFITSYAGFRAPVIDVERQVVFAQWNFRRRGLAKGFTLDGKFYPFMDTQQFPNENLLGEAFKFRDGGITIVHGVFYNANSYKAGTGWPGGRDGPVSLRQ